jgi:hypothetical protein
MKKLLLIMLGLTMTVSTFAQEKECKLKDNYSINTSRIYRGVGLGTSPAVDAKISYDFCDWFSLSTNGVVTTNTLGGGYGSSLENTLTVKRKNLSVSLGDMFFVNGLGSEDYFDYGKETNHLVNGTVKYTDKKIYGLVQTTVLKSEADEKNGVYFETGYKFNDHFSLGLGYVTDASTMNFREKAGFTHVGLTYAKDVKLSSTFKPSLSTTLVFNPSYKDVTPGLVGVNSNPVQFAVGLSF